ncbi:FAH family protein, partial [Pseudomonas ogarae]
AHMCHTPENLEFHHFKHSHFPRPGDVHVPFSRTAPLSFAAALRPHPRAVLDISQPESRAPLVNGIPPVAPAFNPRTNGTL